MTAKEQGMERTSESCILTMRHAMAAEFPAAAERHGFWKAIRLMVEAAFKTEVLCLTLPSADGEKRG